MDDILKPSEAQEIFVHNFKRLFKAWGGSQGVLAREIGVTQSRISYWVHGMATPTFANLYNLSKVFNCALEEFYKDISVEVGEDGTVQC